MNSESIRSSEFALMIMYTENSLPKTGEMLKSLLDFRNEVAGSQCPDTLHIAIRDYLKAVNDIISIATEIEKLLKVMS